MAEFVVKFDSVSKAAVVTKDGEVMANVREACFYARDAKTFEMSIGMMERSEDDGTRQYTQVVAERTAAGLTKAQLDVIRTITGGAK